MLSFSHHSACLASETRSPALQLCQAKSGIRLAGSEADEPLRVTTDAVDAVGLCCWEVRSFRAFFKTFGPPILLKMGVLLGFRFLYHKKENLSNKQFNPPSSFARRFHSYSAVNEFLTDFL